VTDKVGIQAVDVIEERRRAPRYRLDAVIGVNDITGRAIDLSCNGMFFETSRPFTAGDRVALVFPLEHTRPGACVTCEGQVVRVEPRGPFFGIAVTYEPVEFNVPT
jgi:hypothetical protein